MFQMVLEWGRRCGRNSRAEQAYSRTTLQSAWGAGMHRGQQHFGTVPPGMDFHSFSSSWSTFRASIDADRPVVLFLDSYSVHGTNSIVNDGYICMMWGISAYTPSLEQQYVYVKLR